MGCLVTDPFWSPGQVIQQADCQGLYSLETHLDDSQIPGHWPPIDTGSTGVWSMQALMQMGRIQDYQATTSALRILQLLQDGPVSIGVRWYRSMFQPGPDGSITVDLRSGIGGGHQVCLVGCDAEAQTVRIRNSWGTTWGQDGHASMTWGDLDLLMGLGGDAVQPVK